MKSGQERVLGGADGPVEGQTDAVARSGSGNVENLPVERALLLVCHPKEEEFLRARMTRMGFQVTVTRNPYTALDHLRWQSHKLVLSEFHVWSDDARLLFERMRARGEEVPVIFIAEPGDEVTQRAMKAGASRVLSRPFRPADIEEAVRASLPKGPIEEAPTRSGRASGASAERAAGSPAIAEQGAPGVEALDDPGDEVRWLRFFFQVRRCLRGIAGRQARQSRLLTCLRETAGLPAALIAERGPSGLTIVLEEGLAHGFQGPVSREAIARISREAGRLHGELFETLIGEQYAAGSECTAPRPGVLRLSFLYGKSARGSLLAHFGDKVPEGLDAYIEELRLLLALIARGTS